MNFMQEWKESFTGTQVIFLLGIKGEEGYDKV